MITCCSPSLALIIGSESVQRHLKDWSLPELNHGDRDGDGNEDTDGGDGCVDNYGDGDNDMVMVIKR